MELADFLLARIAEDEKAAERAVTWRTPTGFAWIGPTPDEATALCISGHRLLAECEAKRRIIEAAWADHLQIEGEWGHCRSRDELSALNDYPEVVQLLALPYASHPDYRSEWASVTT